MKKKLSIITILMVVASVSAQSITPPKHIVGFRGGLRWNDMRLNYDGYEDYNHNYVYGYSAGIYSRHQLSGNWSLRTDIIYTKRGINLKWSDIRYTIDAQYIDIRLPLQYNLHPISWKASPYLYIGPSLDVAYSGKITYKSSLTPKTSVALNKNNFNTYDIGILGGIGIDIPIQIGTLLACQLSFEVGVDIGLINTFSDDELEGDAPVANPEFANIMNYESRKNWGLETAVGISIPILSGQHVLARPQKEPKESTTVVMEKQDNPTRTPKEKTTWVKQECYSIDDVMEMSTKGYDICGLRICFFDIQFDFNSSELTMASRKKLEPVADLLSSHPKMTVVINGHTDDVGKDEYNNTLSLKRAKSVANYLISNGVNPSRVTYNGYGKQYPIDNNTTAEGRQRNRRVEIEFGCAN